MKELLKIILGGFLFLLSFLLSKTILYYLTLGIAYILLAYPIWIETLKNIKSFTFFDEKFLMIIATVGAFVIGEYPEAVAVMLFYQIGEYLGDKASENTKDAITKLMDLRSDVVHLKQNGELVTLPTEQIKINDIIVVKPGERIPLDGVVVTGESHIDTSSMTGESVLRSVKPNDSIMSGCVNKEGILEIKVTSLYQESTVCKILKLMEEASETKTSREKFITKFASYYTPIVVVAALFITIIPLIFAQPFAPWFYRSLVFLVISCPCALVVSIPLSFFSGIGSCSKKGILIKNSATLENLDQIKTIVFDKTGTLTQGNFEVKKVIPEERKEEILFHASLAEANSNHPIAMAIQNAYQLSISLDTIQEYQEISGKGIRVIYNNQSILVGSDLMLEEEKIKHPKYEEIGTIIYVACNHEYLGTIVIQDSIKESAEQLIPRLKQNGIEKTVMLSGDNEKTVKEVGQKLGLDSYYANLLPTDKVELVKYEQKENRVLFVGDGMNDAPVLMTSDIGVSMGGIGSDAAIEASDIVIMNDDPSLLLTAFQIAKKTKFIVKSNIVFAISIKILIMFLGILGISSMWSAVFADVGVTILTILNALRIFKVRKAQ